MEIRCRKMDCVHNNGCSCDAKNICVFRCGSCGTYKCDPDKKQSLKTDPNIFELAEELVPSRTNNVPLVCRAGICLFNRGGRCHANGIAIIDNDERERADCATYIEK